MMQVSGHAGALDRFRRELSVEQLPAAPEVVQELVQVTSRDDATGREVAALISRDPALCARILSIANSPFVAPARLITTVPQAVLLLGFGQVRDMVLGVSLWGSLEANDAVARQHRQALWMHSVTVAGAARRLAERVGADAGTAFSVGLLHDVGRLVLGLRLGSTYWAMVDDAEARRMNVAAMEREAFGCDHADVAKWLLESWRLPEALVLGAAHHHLPLRAHCARGPGAAVAAVAAANRLVRSSDANAGQPDRTATADVQSFASAWSPEAWPTIQQAVSRDGEQLVNLLGGGGRAGLTHAHRRADPA